MAGVYEEAIRAADRALFKLGLSDAAAPNVREGALSACWSLDFFCSLHSASLWLFVLCKVRHFGDGSPPHLFFQCSFTATSVVVDEAWAIASIFPVRPLLPLLLLLMGLGPLILGQS